VILWKLDVYSAALFFVSTWQDSFELGKREQVPGNVDIELGLQADLTSSAQPGFEGFFEQVKDIENLLNTLTKLMKDLQNSNEESKVVTKASAMKEVKKRMEKDVNEVTKVARLAKSKVEQLNKDVSSQPSWHFFILIHYTCDVLTWTLFYTNTLYMWCTYMDSQLWLLIDFTIYTIVCWFPFSRTMQTDKSQDLARDQVWTDPGQQQLCKAPVIIPLLHIALLSYSWLVGNLSRKKKKIGW